MNRDVYPNLVIFTRDTGEEDHASAADDCAWIENVPERVSKWIPVVDGPGYDTPEAVKKWWGCCSCFIEVIFENGVPVEVKLHKEGE